MSTDQEYEVAWSTYIEGANPVEAADLTQGILTDPGNEAWVFVVKDMAGNKTVVDLDIEYGPHIIATTTPAHKDWMYCPACHSNNINADALTADGTTAYGQVECDDCAATWTEVWEPSHREGVTA